MGTVWLKEIAPLHNFIFKLPGKTFFVRQIEPKSKASRSLKELIQSFIKLERLSLQFSPTVYTQVKSQNVSFLQIAFPNTTAK